MSLGTARKSTIHLPPIPRGFGAFKRWVAAAIRRIAQAAGVAVQIDGAENASTSADGTLRFKVGAGGVGAASQGLDVGSDGKVIAATVMGVMPTIGGTALDDATPPTLTIPSSGTRYIVINIAGTFSLKASTFVLPTYSGTPTVTITVETTDPSYAGIHNVSSGTFKFSLATFVDGVKTAQNGHGPITAEICDNLKAEAKANLAITYAGA